MTYRFSIRSLLTSALAVLLLSPSLLIGQKPTVETVKKVLTEAGFSAEELASVENGEVVVKELTGRAPGEVAFCSVLKLDGPRDIVFDSFRRAIEKQRKEVADQNGIFRDPPTTDDLKKLDISAGDLRGLRDCKPGDCSWSLSNDLIRRVSEDIDWTASDATDKASEMIKEIMAENFANYLKSGDSALMDYNDDPEPLSLADEQKSLLAGLLWINDFAPEFTGYLSSFPQAELDGTEDLATWEKVQIGFKDVIVNTHTIFYKKESDGIPQGFILTKQVYANHYFHSSMALTGIVSFPNPDETFSSYVFFINHSRAGALTGTMGKIARIAVDGEAEKKMTNALVDTLRFTKIKLGNIRETESEPEPGFLQRFFGNKLVIGALVMILLIGVAAWFARRSRK